MPIRKIIVPVDGTAATQLSLDTAFRLARDLEAHVEVIHARPDPRLAVPLLGEGMSGAMIEELIDLTEKESAARAMAARQMFDRVCETSGMALSDAPPTTSPPTTRPTAGWVEVMGAEDDVLVRRGRLADLLVVARPTEHGDAPSAVSFNAAVFESGRPVLVAPTGAVASVGRRVAISWNGSAEAARAVSAAMPVLKRAESVLILNVDTDDTAGNGASSLTELLGWHGVSAESRTIPDDQGPVGAAIIAACGDADLLVMGAYTHSRLLQLILGGVTRHVLENAKLPLLMAH